MDEQKIKLMIQQEIQRASGMSQFGVQNVPFHTHNGIESPTINYPTLTYAGFIPYTENAGAGFILPESWTVQLNADTSYTIFHNLGTFFYSFVVTKAQTTPVNSLVVPEVICDAAGVTIGWIDPNDIGAGFKTTNFYFLLTVINNKTSPLIPYNARAPVGT